MNREEFVKHKDFVRESNADFRNSVTVIRRLIQCMEGEWALGNVEKTVLYMRMIRYKLRHIDAICEEAKDETNV